MTLKSNPTLHMCCIVSSQAMVSFMEVCKNISAGLEPG
jgi:hypothetical protein